MFILRIEHAVMDFDSWKRAFDNDPVGRQKSGVRRYHIMRPVDNPKYVIVDLELDSADQAESLLGALRGVWRQVEGKAIMNPKAQIVEAVETKSF